MPEKLARTIAPDLPMDRNVKGTQNREQWYKVVGSTMYVPPINHLKVSPQEVSRFCEAIVGFSRFDLTVKQDWNIPYTLYTGLTESLNAIKHLNTFDFIICDIECSNLKWDDNNLIIIGFKGRGEHHVHQIACFDIAVVYALNKLFAREDITFCWHNGKFDISRMEFNKGIKARVDEDTMLMHYVQINEKRGTHRLKDLAPLYLQAPDWDAELREIIKSTARKRKIKMADFNYDELPLEILCPYNAMDLYATELLFELFKSLAREDTEFIYRTLIHAANVFAQVEQNGFAVDMEYLNLLHIKLQEDSNIAEDVLQDVAREYWDPMQYSRETGAKYPGKYFNHRSPKQLKWLLEAILGVNVETTNADQLEVLVKEHPDSSFLNALTALRTLNKQMDTYVSGMREHVCKDGRIRASFNLHGTETGRLSSSDPNMQNIPRDSMIRNIFKSEEGKVLVSLDYSQAELRVLAQLTEDPWLANVFSSGQDLHDMVATSMFGPNFTKEQRVQAKTINFGIAYGRGAGSLRDEFGISFSEAIGLINKWYDPMPKVKKWINETRQLPSRGITSATQFGRVRNFVITNTNINAIQNEAVNFPVSSTASDFTLISLLKIYETVLKSAYNARIRIINSVHDSIIFEIDDDEKLIAWLVDIGKEVMENVPIDTLQYTVPFRADAEKGYSWGDMNAIV